MVLHVSGMYLVLKGCVTKFGMSGSSSKSDSFAIHSISVDSCL